MSMVHNTFDVNKKDDNTWEAVSHNFPEIKAEGKSDLEAIDNLVRAVKHFADNDKIGFKKKLKDRLSKGLECACGKPLDPNNLIIGIAGT